MGMPPCGGGAAYVGSGGCSTETKTVRFLRRRKFVVDPRLQISFLLITLGYVGFLLLVLSVSLFAPLVFQLRHADSASPDVLAPALSILYLHDRFWLPALLAIIVIVLHSVRTTHRIAGPLYRFRRVFEALRDGVLPRPVRLRKGDYLTEEMDIINGALQALRGEAAQLQEQADTLHECLRRFREQSAAANGGVATDDLWNELAARDQQLRDAVHAYHIEN